LASAFTHAFTGLMAGKIAPGEPRPRKAWLCLVVLPVLPDLDFFMHRMGIPRESIWNHRGITHSLFFALLLSILAKALWFKELPWSSRKAWNWVGLLLLAIASHGFLDAFTDGGSGVAFFAPFSAERYFFPWHVIRVSPLSIGRFFDGRAWPILQSEFLWVWLPLLALWGLARLFRARSGRKVSP